MVVEIVRQFKKQLLELNLFKLQVTRLEAFDVRMAIISTRIYIILFSFALVILTVLTALDGRSETIIVRNPSGPIFKNLNDRFADTLSCTCKKSTILYGSFISMKATYHPVCSSLFASGAWINLLFNSNISFYYPLDFRSTASGHFQLLSSLCTFTKRFVSDAIDDFLVDTLFSYYTLSPISFDLKVSRQSLFLQISTENTFQQLLQLVRTTFFDNQLQTALQTSIIQVLYHYNETLLIPFIVETSFSDVDGTTCRCGSNRTCSSSVTGFFDIFAKDTLGSYTLNEPLRANVTGFAVGCYTVESVLQSTLECLFDISCLNGILAFFPLSNSIVKNPLNLSQTRFPPKTTVDTLVSNVFVENWSIDSSFDYYYAECAPILCSYTLTAHNNFLYVLIKLVSMYGGLAIVFRLCIPRVVSWWYNRKRTNTGNNIRKNRYYIQL